MFPFSTRLTHVRAPSHHRSASAARRRRFARAALLALESLESRVLLTTTLYVDPSSPGPTHDGTSWATAYSDLQPALIAALPDTQILVADGTYKPTSTTDRNATFQLKNDVSLLGGYAGYGAPDPNARDASAYPTILSGELGNPADSSDNSYHVVTGSNTTLSAVLDGFIITFGAGYGIGDTIYGAGMYNVAGSPTVRNCIFTSNRGNYGAGMYNANSNPAISNCTFSLNAASYGSAIYNASSSPSIIGCVFAANTGNGTLQNSNADPTIVNSIFVNNNAGDGGVLRNGDSSPSLLNCTFTANLTGRYGSIYNYSSNTSLTNCILWDQGPLIYNNTYSSTTATFCNIKGGYPGAGNIDADPLFVRAPWAGPDGTLASADDDYGDLRLRTGSPALDIGNNAALPADITIDLAGNPRIQNLTVDLGAYEGPVSVPAPKIIFVDANAPGSNTGASWTDAFTSLQSALLAAADSDTIHIADGTYKPTTTTDRKLSFVLRNHVAIYGGFAGYDAPDPDARNTSAYPTTLSGDIGIPGANTDNSNVVLTAVLVDNSCILDGLTITAAYNGDYGGGMRNNYASPTINNCAFVSNTASSGAGMYNAYSSPLLTNVLFALNYANYHGSGGAMYNLNSSPTLINSTIALNIARSDGAAISNYTSLLTLTNCIVWGHPKPFYTNAGAPVVTYSNIQGGYPGTGNINADPLFVRSPWAGPDATFGTADDDYGDLRLRATSPALDIGNNAALPADITTDLAGNPRIQNITVDLGAYEGPVSAPAPKTIYVDINAPGSNTGTSWTDAFTSLQSALLAAADTDTIRIADGTYKPTATTDRKLSFVLRNNVALYGGFAGAGAADPDARDTALYPTILSGDIGSTSSSTDNSANVLKAIAVGTASILDGLTVTGGYCGGVSVGGGGIYLSYAAPTLNNCIFTANSSGPSNNYAGGAMFTSYSSPLLTNCTFSANTSAGAGGAMFNDRSTVTLTHCTFTGNSASGGGAIQNINSTLIATDSLFLANSVNYTSYEGGAISLINSSANLTTCTFTANAAPYGGAISAANSTLTATNSLFVANAAQMRGGAIAINNASALLVNSTFTANAAPDGGALYFIGNPKYSVTASNCILWNNGTSNISGALTATYCDIQQTTGAFPGTGNLNADPQFIRTPSGADYGDLRLRNTSPCIDAGNNLAPGILSLTTDLAGAPRIQSFPAIPDTGIGAGSSFVVDLGAYESVPAYAYYHNSSFDGGPSIASALAPDKLPLLPGQIASFANYSSVSAGLNGIVLDIPGIHGPFAAEDFTFKVGNSNDPDSWTLLSTPATINSYTIASICTRIVLTLPDNAIQNTWLQTTLKGGPDSTSGLPADLVFYFGSAPGDTGNNPASARVDMLDELTIRANYTTNALITNPYDLNRDGTVDGVDEIVARTHTTWFLSELHLISPPALAPSFALSTLTEAATLGTISASVPADVFPEISVLSLQSSIPPSAAATTPATIANAPSPIIMPPLLNVLNSKRPTPNPQLVLSRPAVFTPTTIYHLPLAKPHPRLATRFAPLASRVTSLKDLKDLYISI